jgi:fermentation-respiration switch protein FrsA (DUF1100 family)
MKKFFAHVALSLLALTGTPGGAAAQVTEAQFIKPVPGGTLTAQQVRAVAPVFSLTAHDIPVQDGGRLHAVVLRRPKARGTLVYFGGNGFTMERFGASTAAVFAPFGVNVVLVDHRGYGRSTGMPTAALLEADGLAVFDFVRRLRGIDRMKIIVHGQSLGSFTAGYVAANRPTAGAVLESSVTTIQDWVVSQAGAEMARRMTIAPTLQGRGNSRHMLTITEPLLLVVGEADRTTPASMSRALHAASPLAASRKFLAVIPGAGHNDAMLRPEAAEAYRRFLDRALGSRGPASR